jgi:TfoX/Sxy family transcriptional regulator of competence genes
MATTLDYIEYVCGQIEGTGAVRHKKMFGDYMVYVNDKPVLLVCDNTVFVKMLPELAALLQGADKGFPYDGAKEHYVLDIDRAELARTVVAILESITSPPKPRKKKAKRHDAQSRTDDSKPD